MKTEQALAWDGGWLIALTHDLGRTDRKQLRARERALALFGYREAGGAMWVRPANLAGALDDHRAELTGIGADEDITLLKVSGVAAPTADACPVAACTNAPLPGYNWSKSGGTTPTSCVHAFCNNTRRNDEYYTINGLGGSDGCQVARCAAQLPTGHYWLGAGDCAYQPCGNKPPSSEYSPFANNLGADCAFRCVEGYFFDSAAALCSPCPAGTFSPAKGATACAQCVAGLHYPATNAVLTAATGQTSCGFDCGDAFWRSGLNCVPFTSEITATMTTQAFALVLDGGASLRLCNLSAPYQTTETVGNLPGGPFAAVAVHPRDSRLIYAGTSGHGLLYSRDGGATWRHYVEFPAQSVQSIAFDPADPTRIVVTTFGQGVFEGPYLPR